MKLIISLLLVATMSSCSISKNSAVLPTISKITNKPIATFPFELKPDNQLYIRVKVNKVDSLIFNIDTGASSYVIVDSIARNKLKLDFDGEDINIGANSTTKIESSSKNTITIGNIELDNLTLYSIPYEDAKFDGILGCKFFLSYVVDINYDRKTIKLYDPKTYKYNGSKKRLQVKIDNGVPFIKSAFMLNDKLFEDWFMLDTGADDRVSFNSSAVTSLNLEEKLKIIGSSSSVDSNGKIYKSPLVLLKEIKISNYSFYNVIASLSKATTGTNASDSHIGALGNIVLNKMNIIYNLSNNCLYLEPRYFK